tara:strand:- start:1189 stop:1332 length:144 start_codon:yes stop_codon:yes gene_type:complete
MKPKLKVTTHDPENLKGGTLIRSCNAKDRTKSRIPKNKRGYKMRKKK